MRRGYALVEGQTEEQFIKQVLNPALAANRLFLQPIVLKTSRTATRAHRGGMVSFAKVTRELQALLADSSAVVVTTMFDYYALPSSFPHMPRPAGRSALTHCQLIEQAIATQLNDSRLLPYLSLHEFEALLFSHPPAIQSQYPNRDILPELEHIRQSFATPEDIDLDQPPSRRLTHPAVLPQYRKVAAGPQIATRIGLAAMRTACPHFAGWINQLLST